jgi:hypothetical protein
MERQTRRTEEEKERKARSRHTVGSKSMGLHWSNNIFSKITKTQKGGIRRRKKSVIPLLRNKASQQGNNALEGKRSERLRFINKTVKNVCVL